MPRLSARLCIPAVVLLALLVLSPTFAAALPLGQSGVSAAERFEAGPGVFSRLWSFLSAVWTNGPGLDPNGVNTGSSSGSGPDASTGDTGPGLEPNG